MNINEILEKIKETNRKMENDPVYHAQVIKENIETSDAEYRDVDALATAMYNNFDLFFPEHVKPGRKTPKAIKEYISKRYAQIECDEYHNIHRKEMINEYYKLTGVKLK